MKAIATESDAPPRGAATDVADGTSVSAAWRVLVRRGVWLVPALLALLAYAPALGIGFIGDDFILLNTAHDRGLDFSIFMPSPAAYLYRPVSGLLTWHVGWQLFGLNALPYHLLGLLLHAGSAVLLGLWVKEVSQQRLTGLLAGALFAVYPLHVEAVGWLAAQWDAWALFFGTLGLLLFTRWWRQGQRDTGDARLLGLAVVAYGLGIFSKESMLLFLPMYPIAALAVSKGLDRRGAARLILAVVLLGLVLGLNVALRLIGWGSLSGPAGIMLFSPGLIWNHLLGYGQVLLAPLNAALFSPLAQQVVGVLAGLALLIGLIWKGWAQRWLLLLAVCWLVFGLGPVLNVAVTDADNLANNRFLYLPSAGFCVGVAAIVSTFFSAWRRWRPLFAGVIGLVLAGSVAVSWVNLTPWHVATTQVDAMRRQLEALVPPQPRPNGIIWYVHSDNAPDSYKGAHIIGTGLGMLRQATTGERVWLRYRWHAGEAPLAERPDDAFAFHFAEASADLPPRIDYAAGISSASPPPSSAQAGTGLRVWDLRTCAAEVLAEWQVRAGEAECEPERGLLLGAAEAGPQLDTALNMPAPDASASFVRLRVAVACTDGCAVDGVLRWSWQVSDSDQWQQEPLLPLPLKPGGEQNVYWSFVPASVVRNGIANLSLKLINGGTEVQIAWIALDLVGD